METEIFHLNLASPVFCIPMEGAEPFAVQADNIADLDTERVFCFELDQAEHLSFEPDRDKLLGLLVFGGLSKTVEAGTAAAAGKAETPKQKIPQGAYLFAQKRELLDKEEIITLAVEIQKEGLWQRLKLGKNLYLRYLFEDGSWVTQLFRPCFA